MKVAFTTGLAALMMIFLAACGGSAAPTNTDTPSTNPTSSDSTTSSATAGDEAAGLEFIHYTVQLSGATTAQFEGTLEVITLGDEQRLISFAGPDMTVQAILQIPLSVQPGDYALTESGDTRAQISTSFEDSGMYTSDVSGTLKITSGSPLAGSFDYSAKNEAGETVSASGTFEEVVYSYSASVSGAEEATLPPGNVRVSPFQDENTLTFEAEGGFTITFYMPNTAAAGEYGLATTFPKPAEGQIGVIINGAEGAAYDAGITGTLTFTEVGQQFSGSFKVTAANSDDQSITAEGSFEKLPLLGGQEKS